MTLQLKLDYFKTIDEIAKAFVSPNESVLLTCYEQYETDCIHLKLFPSDKVPKMMDSEVLEAYLFDPSGAIYKLNLENDTKKEYNSDWNHLLTRWSYTNDHKEARVIEYNIEPLKQKMRDTHVTFLEIAQHIYQHKADGESLPITAFIETNNLTRAHLCVYKDIDQGLDSFTYCASSSSTDSRGSYFTIDSEKELVRSEISYDDIWFIYDTFGVNKYIEELFSKQSTLSHLISFKFNTIQLFAILNNNWDANVEADWLLDNTCGCKNGLSEDLKTALTKVDINYQAVSDEKQSWLQR